MTEKNLEAKDRNALENESVDVTELGDEDLDDVAGGVEDTNIICNLWGCGEEIET